MLGRSSALGRRHGYRAVLTLGLLIALVVLSGCESTYVSIREGTSESLGTGRTFAIFGLEGRWAGDVTPLAADCGAPTRGSMTVSAHGFAFDPFGSTFVINGSVSDSGAFQGTLKRRLSADSAKSERSLTFTGNGQEPADGAARIVGRLESGRCAWRVSLERA